VNPLRQGHKGPASSPFGYFVAKGGAKGKVRGFAPCPLMSSRPSAYPILSSRLSVSYPVIPTERSAWRDPQEKMRKYGRPSSVGRQSRPTPSPQGEGREVPCLFGQVPCRGRGFAPYPPYVIPTERSAWRDPQERTRGQEGISQSLSLLRNDSVGKRGAPHPSVGRAARFSPPARATGGSVTAGALTMRPLLSAHSLAATMLF